MAGELSKITFKTTRGNALVKLFGLALLVALAACTLSSETVVSPTPTMMATAVPQTQTRPEQEAAVVPTTAPTWTPDPTATPTPRPTPSPTLTPSPEPCTTPGQIITGTFASEIAGPERNYRVYLPPCYGEEGRLYPTLYMFHGNIGSDGVWDELRLDEAAEALIQSGEIPPLIIAMPDGGFLANNSSGGPNSFEGVILNEFIPFMEKTYCAWPEAAGRAIGGLSRGGYWALEIAFRSPELFVSVGGHSAALLDSAAGPELNPQFTGLSNDLGDLRIYLDIGRDDYLLPNIQRLHEEMEAAGRPHLWVLNEGSHEDGYWALHGSEYLIWYSEPWPLDESSYQACKR